MNVKQLLVILFGISLLSSVALADTYGQVVNTGSTDLKVRTEPERKTDNDTDKLQHGKIVKILDVHGPWYEIEYYHKGLTGFSFGSGFSFGNDVKFRYIRLLDLQKHDGYVVVIKPLLYVRNGPSYDDFPVIAKAARNSTLQTLSKVTYYKELDKKTVSWFKVQDRNGDIGYINGGSEYVRPLVDKSNPELDNPEKSSKCDSNKNQDVAKVHSNCHCKASTSHTKCMETCEKLGKTPKEEYKNCKEACEKRRGTSREYCDSNYINSPHESM